MFGNTKTKKTIRACAVGLVALALVALLTTPAIPVASALNDGCSFSGDYGSCTFACVVGEHIHVSAYDTNQISGHYPRTHATCGSVDGYCQAHLSCNADLGATSSSGIGTCYSETVQNTGSCWTTAN